jgi:Zn finger protein HypA/HybF involved in hydrogenase expression
MNSIRDEFKINILRDVKLSECICRDCGNKFKGLPVNYIECPACHSSNISKK